MNNRLLISLLLMAPALRRPGASRGKHNRHFQLQILLKNQTRSIKNHKQKGAAPWIL